MPSTWIRDRENKKTGLYLFPSVPMLVRPMDSNHRRNTDASFQASRKNITIVLHLSSWIRKKKGTSDVHGSCIVFVSDVGYERIPFGTMVCLVVSWFVYVESMSFRCIHENEHKSEKETNERIFLVSYDAIDSFLSFETRRKRASIESHRTFGNRHRRRNGP